MPTQLNEAKFYFDDTEKAALDLLSAKMFPTMPGRPRVSMSNLTRACIKYVMLHGSTGLPGNPGALFNPLKRGVKK
jgi:hypothetical protein